MFATTRSFAVFAIAALVLALSAQLPVAAVTPCPILVNNGPIAMDDFDEYGGGIDNNSGDPQILNW